MMKPRLLSVARASAEVTAGILGHCAVSVRVLDDVTLRIHAGELLLLQAPEALGQSMLLAALAGREQSPRHRYVRAVREAVPGLRIRRAALHLDAVWEILRGWQEAIVSTAIPGSAGAGAAGAGSAGAGSAGAASRTLYLLRASRQGGQLGGALTLREAAEWRRWGRQAHERRDGVVIACPPLASPFIARQPLATPHDQVRHALTASSAHEPSATYDARAVAAEARTIRLLELRAGRLHTVRTPRGTFSNAAGLTADPARYPRSADGSGDAHAPTASHQSPIASTEP